MAEWLATASSGPGVLVLDGVIAVSVRVGDRIATELVGGGDLLQSRCTGEEELIACELEWRALVPSRFAMLDAAFAQRVQPWPQITSALLRRAGRRAHNLDVQRAIASQPRLEVRLALLLWHLAARWGKVEPGGIRLQIPAHPPAARTTRGRRAAVRIARARPAGAGGARDRATAHEWHLHGSLEDQLATMIEHGWLARRPPRRADRRRQGALMRSVEFAPGHAYAERQLIHVLWLTSGLGCDGDTIAMTAATSPSLEDLLRGVLPGVPRLVLYNPLLAFESGEEFMAAFWRAADGGLNPFMLVLEGSVPNEQISGEGHWAALGVDPDSGQPITTSTWIERLVPHAAAVLALGTCAAYGGIPAMRGNPTGAMGLRDYLGPGLAIAPRCPDHQPPRLPGPARQHHRDAAPARSATSPASRSCPSSTSRDDRDGCSSARCRRAAAAPDSPSRVNSRRPPPTIAAVWSSSAAWARSSSATSRSAAGSNGIGGCPNVGGICHACTMPGFPDKFMPFMEPSRTGLLAVAGARFTYGPLMRGLRKRAMRGHFDLEPEWRRRGEQLSTGYERRW